MFNVEQPILMYWVGRTKTDYKVVLVGKEGHCVCAVNSEEDENWDIFAGSRSECRRPKLERREYCG